MTLPKAVKCIGDLLMYSALNGGLLRLESKKEMSSGEEEVMIPLLGGN